MNRLHTFAFVLLLSLSSLVLAGAPREKRNGVTSRPEPVNRTAGDVTISQNGQTRTIACKGGTVTVTGNKNTLTLTGQCSALNVEGNDNTVAVETVAEISTPGNRNRVTWTRGAGEKPPKISNLGTGNTIKKAEK